MSISVNSLAIKFAKKLIKVAQRPDSTVLKTLRPEMQSGYIPGLIKDNQKLLIANSGISGTKVNISDVAVNGSMINVSLTGIPSAEFIDQKSSNFRNINILQRNIEGFLNARLGGKYSVSIMPSPTLAGDTRLSAVNLKDYTGKALPYEYFTGKEPGGAAYVEKEQPKPEPEPEVKKPRVIKSGPPMGYVIRPRGKENDPYADRRVSYKAWMAATPEKKRGWTIVRKI